MFHTISDILKVIKPDEKLSYFGEGQITLNSHNIIYLDLPDLPAGKALTFGKFKRHIYYYSEMMNTPCVTALAAVEGSALMNARKGKRARENYTR